MGMLHSLASKAAIGFMITQKASQSALCKFSFGRKPEWATDPRESIEYGSARHSPGKWGLGRQLLLLGTAKKSLIQNWA